MINIKFNVKRFKIYSDGKIRSLKKYSDTDMLQLKEITEIIEGSYKGPQDGFPVSRMAKLLPNYGVEVINYRDYEMENADPNTIY